MEEGRNTGDSRKLNFQVGELLQDWEGHGHSLTEGDRHAVHQHLHSPQGIAIKVITAIGAALAAIMGLAVIALLVDLDTDRALILIGTLFIGLYALYIFRRKDKEGFMNPFMISVGFLGQILISFFLLENYPSGTELAWSLLILEVLLLAINPDGIQKLVSSILIVTSIWGLVHLSELFFLIHLLVTACAFGLAYCWTHEAKLVLTHPNARFFIEPVGVGLAIGCSLILFLSIHREIYTEFVSDWWPSTLGIGCALSYAVHFVIKYYHAQKWRIFIFGSIIAVLIPSILSPGIAFALLVTLLGFFRQQRILLALGTILIITFSIAFYYNMQVSLLWKSVALIVTGVLMLGIRQIIERLQQQ